MLKRSIIASGFLHLAVIVVATVSWPHAIAHSDESPPVVPVDLVTIAEETNVAPTVAPQKPPEPEQQAPPPQQQAAPPPPDAEVAPADLDKAKPKELPKEADAAPAPPKPALPRRKPRPDPQQSFNVDSVLALLDKRAPKAPPPPPNAKPAEQTIKGFGAQTALTVDLQDALLAQMRECWNVPVGAPNPEQLIVQVRVFLAQDGTLVQAQLEPQSRTASASNPFMRAAAEQAMYAVRSCSPYKYLPPDRYDAWREIVMTFDPTKMAGR